MTITQLELDIIHKLNFIKNLLIKKDKSDKRLLINLLRLKSIYKI